MLRVNERIAIPLRELELSFARSGGPGGQNVNKVASKVTLRWDVAHSPSLPADVRDRFLQRYANRVTAGGELVLVSSRTREQHRNIEDCYAKLREMLAAVARPQRKRKPTRPGRAATERRLKQKRSQAQRKRERRRPQGED